MTQLVAPWTHDQVSAINLFQQAGIMHPFTCGNRSTHPDDEGVLIAYRDELRCPACNYHQTWVHAHMADREWIEKQQRWLGEFLGSGL